MTSIDPGAVLLPKAPVGAPPEPALKRAEPRPNDRDMSSRGDGRDDFAFALNSAAGVQGTAVRTQEPGVRVAPRSDRPQAVPVTETQPGSAAGTADSPGRVEQGSRDAGGASTGSSVAADDTGGAREAQASGVTGKAGAVAASGDGGSAPTVETAPGGGVQAQPGEAAEETARQAAALGRLAGRAGAEHVELWLNGLSTRLSPDQGNGSRSVVQPAGPGGQVADSGEHQAPGSTGAYADANAAAGETSGSTKATSIVTEHGTVPKPGADSDGLPQSHVGNRAGTPDAARQGESRPVTAAAGGNSGSPAAQSEAAPGTPSDGGSRASTTGGRSGGAEAASHVPGEARLKGGGTEGSSPLRNSPGSGSASGAVEHGAAEGRASSAHTAGHGARISGTNGSPPSEAINSQASAHSGASGGNAGLAQAGSDTVRPSGEKAAVPAGAEAPPAMESTTQESRLVGGRTVSSANSAATAGSTGSEAQGQRAAVPVSQAARHDGGVPAHTAESGRTGTGAAGGSGNIGAVDGSARGSAPAAPGTAAAAQMTGPADTSPADGAQSADAPAPMTHGEAGGAAHGSREAGESARTPGAGEMAGGLSGPSARVVAKYDGTRIPGEESARQERESIRSDTSSPPIHGRIASGTTDGSASRQASGAGQAAGSVSPPASQETQAAPLPAADIVEGLERPATAGAGRDDLRSTADLQGPTAQARPATGPHASVQTTGQVVAPQPQSASDPGNATRILEVTEMPEFLPHTLRAAVRDGVREANIRLWPPELGAIKVQLHVNGNQVTALIRAERPDAYALLDRMRGALQRGMQESGLILHRLEIDLGGSTALRPASSAGAGQFERDGDPSQRGATDPGHGDRSGTPSSSSQGNRGDADPQERRGAGLNPQVQAVRGGRQGAVPVRRTGGDAGGVDAWA